MKTPIAYQCRPSRHMQVVSSTGPALLKAAKVIQPTTRSCCKSMTTRSGVDRFSLWKLTRAAAAKKTSTM